MPKTYEMTSTHVDEYVSTLEGTYLDERHYDLLISHEDADVLKPDGSPLLMLRHRALEPSVCRRAYEPLLRAAKPSVNRGVAAGGRYRRIRQDGTRSNTLESKPVLSGIIGYYERTARVPFCRKTAYTSDDVAGWEDVQPFVRAVDAVFRETWARDKADKRPEFQRLMKQVESGLVGWIVVDALDRFGTKDAHQLLHYLYRLRESGCKLYDGKGTEWTGADIATIITAVVEGDKSKGEQTSKSQRVIGGKAEKARQGEYQGGPVRLGLDVACYSRETGKELWRVVIEGRDKRLKVFPDGHSERFDGKDNFPKCQPSTEVLRVAPSKDKDKIAAAVSVFKRYASESLSFCTLANYLNKLGWRNGMGGHFQAQQIEEMLGDEIYLGYYTWNKWHFGKFHRYENGRAVEEENYGEKGTKNAKENWVKSNQRLFEPLVSRETWSKVQDKLENRKKRGKAPRTPEIYLAGLVRCGNCGKPMVSGSVRKQTQLPRKDDFVGKRYEYFCGTYFKAVREGRRGECTCLRNGVFQDVLEQLIDKWLEESGRRLEVLADKGTGNPFAQLQKQEEKEWQAFNAGFERLTAYLDKHHPNEYSKIVDHYYNNDGRNLADFTADCAEAYRRLFNKSALDTEIAKLKTEHDALVDQWGKGKLPTERAKEIASARLVELDRLMTDLENQRDNLADAVAAHWREINDLQQAIAKARIALRKKDGEVALRKKAQALRAVIQRIECSFTATGQAGGGWGKKSSRLVSVTIYPVVGDPFEFTADSGTSSKGTLLYSSAHSFIYRT